MVFIPEERLTGTLSAAVGGVGARRLLSIAAACAVLATLVVTLVLVRPWSDPNHESADHVLRNAGIPAGVTPGPTR